MFSIKKKENKFLLVVILTFIFYIFFPELFWQITNTPYIKALIIDKIPEGKELAITAPNYYDLRYLQYISGYFDNIHLPSDQFYNLYKHHDSEMVINYPRIWITIAHFVNIRSDIVLYTIYLLFFLLYTNIFYFFTKKTNSYFFFYLFFCGANLLLLERGNVDIILIVIVFYSFLCKNKFINYIGYLTVSILKIYPSFSLLFFLNKRKSIKIILSLSVIFVIYLFIIKEDIEQIKMINPINGHSAYGFLSLIINFKDYFDIDINYTFIVVCNLFIILLVYYSIFKKKLRSIKFKYSKIFLIGGGIYIFTFLINTHHDYRMMFLIFCAPLILNIDNKNFKFLYLIILFFSLELQRLLFVFGFFGGIINSLSKLILFYITSMVYLNIIEKKLSKVINLKKISTNE